jgi:hypothetical protein
MRELSRLILGSILLVLLFMVVGTAVILGWSIGIGWLLTLILPFTWFETSLLVIIASVAVGALGIRMLLAAPPSPMTDTDELIEPPILTDRFYPADGPVTSEAWFRFEMANDIYWELTDTPSIDNSLDETEMKELAIRLTDIVVEMLQARLNRSRRINVTANQLKQQMKKMNLRPYDNDILQAAASAVTLRLSFDQMMADIVYEKSWDEIMHDLF